MTIDPTLLRSLSSSTAASGPAPDPLDPKDRLAQTRLDLLQSRSRPSYTLPSDLPRRSDARGAPAATLTVPSPFRMSSEQDDPRHVEGGQVVSRTAPSLARRLTLALPAGDRGRLGPAVTRVTLGQGTPEQIKQVTQALIDGGKLHETLVGHGWKGQPLTDAQLKGAVRAMQHRHGVGVDCASYVRQAFDAIRPGGGHGLPGLRVGGLQSNRNFRPIEPQLARPGDIVDLGSIPGTREPGHFVIVRDRRLATAADTRRLGLDAVPGFKGGKVHLFEVDSSWGGSRLDVTTSGAQRRLWLYDEQGRGTQKWATVTADPAAPGGLRVQPSTVGPYDHPLDGIYRRR